MCNAFSLLFILLCCGYSIKIIKSADFLCTSNADCRSDRHVGYKKCSVCADSNSGEPKCVFPFPYMFQTDNLDCDRIQPCPIDCPEDRGKCLQKTIDNEEYTPGCGCHSHFYGPQCQYEDTISQKPISYVTWRFRGFIPVYRNTELKFAFFSFWSFDLQSLTLVLKTSDGLHVRRAKFKELPGNCYFDSKNCTALPVNVQFPFKSYSHNSFTTTQFITLKDRVLGYYTNFSVLAMYLGNVIYDRQFQIVVSYEEIILKCIASIKLRNCSPSPDTPNIITRLTDLDFISEILFLTDGGYISKSVANDKCSDANIFTWKLWPFTGDEEMSPPLFESYTNQAWRFNPYTLNIGMYKVYFNVRHVDANLASNFAYCYIKVKSLPLIIRVDGGSERMVNKNDGVTLSAARSTDPNMPASEQGDLRVDWSCKRIKPPTDYDPICKTKTMIVQMCYYIPPNLLMYSAVYNFTLKLWSKLYINCEQCNVKPEYEYIIIKVGNETSTKGISIHCVENCENKVIPNKPFFLKVTNDNHNVSTVTGFNWTYSTGSGIQTPLDSIKVVGLPSFMMLLKEDSLKSGTEYTFTVRDNLEGSYAKYSFITESFSYDGVCKVEPLNGTRALTKFNIICPLKIEVPLLFDFYDKSYEDTTNNQSFDGRMLGTTSTGQLKHVMLSRGYVTVFIIGPQGMSIKQEIIVNLSGWNVTTDLLTSLFKKISCDFDHFDYQLLRFMSLYTDVLPIGSIKEKEFNFLLTCLSKTQLNTFENIKMVSSTFPMLLKLLNGPVRLKIKPKVFFISLDFIYRLTNMFRSSVLNRETSQYVQPLVITEMTENVLLCFTTLLKFYSNKTEHKANHFNYMTELNQGSDLSDDIIDNIKDILTFIQHPGKPPIRISTNNDSIIFWSLKNDIDYPITSFLGVNSGIPVEIPDQLMYSLTNSTIKSMDLSLQIAYIGDSDLKRYMSDIKSELVSVSLGVQEDNRDLTYIHTLRHPLAIHMTMDDNLENLKLEGSVIQADPSLDQDYLDMQVKIHRLDITPRSRLTIVFLYPPTNGSLRVSVMEEYRPDFNHMIKHSIIISKESVEYPYHYHEYDAPRFLYMGIIPGKEVSVNESVSYSFEINTTLCQYWSRGSWKSEGCLVSHYNQGKSVICQCTHLSTFGTAFLVPPQQVDPFKDAQLFLTVLDNPLVVALVTTFLVIYIVVCFYLWRIDKRDEMKKNVIVLEDNFPYDKYPYLMAVFTSPRLNAGTTAHVGVKLVGSEAESRPHILTNSRRKVLKTGSDDWFLIYCPEYLGKIEHLHVWHDNAGWSPSWCCDKIFVYDLTKNTETKFFVEEWLAVDLMRKEKESCFPEAKVLPYKNENILSVKTRFFDNVVLGIRDGHKITRVFYRHPRSRVTRVQRFSIIIVFLMLTMLNSIMYYKPADETRKGVDDYRFSVGMKEAIISVQSLILSTALTCILFFTFKRSLKPRDIARSSTLSNKTRKTKQTVRSAFLLQITSIMKYAPLNPVQLPKSPQIIEKQWICFIFAWVSCITIISTSSYLIMLYGLKLGPVKSQKWLTSVLLSMGEDIFIIGPAKIILFAVVFSLAFQLISDVNTYQFKIEDLHQDHLLSDNDAKEIFIIRKHKMYTPLPLAVRVSILQYKRLVSNWWTFWEFVLATAFLLTTCSIIFQLWSSHYYTNSHIRNMVANTKYSFLHSISFNKITNISQMEQYLSNTFVNIVYNIDERWNGKQRLYQGSCEDYPYLTVDLTNKLMGLPKIRQFRMEAVPCNNTALPKYLCIPEWKESSEDTNLYSKEWRPGNYFDSQRNESYWVYRSKSSSFNTAILRLYGPSGRLFHDGGYSATLGPTRLEAEQTLDEMEEYRWQDEKTRVVFVELTTFNGNKILFSQVTLLVEYLVSGAVLLNVRVTSVSSIFNVNLSICLFVVFIVVYTLKAMYLINHYGLLGYIFSGIDSLFHIFCIVIGILSIVLFCAHFYAVPKYTDRLIKSGCDEYFEFDLFVQYFVLLRISLLILQCLTTFLFIGSIRGGKSVTIIFYTFTSPIRYIYCLSLLILVAFVVLWQWSLLLVITSFSFKELLLNRKSLKFATVNDLQYTYVKLFIVCKMISIFILKSMFLAVLLISTRLSKSHVFSVSQRFNFITFIASRITLRWKKIMSR